MHRKYKLVNNQFKSKLSSLCSCYIFHNNSIYFLVILLIYMPVSIVGYLVYGENTNENIILSLDTTNYRGLITAANLLIAIHLTMAFLIITNPASQEIENFFNISPSNFMHIFYCKIV